MKKPKSLNARRKKAGRPPLTREQEKNRYICALILWNEREFAGLRKSGPAEPNYVVELGATPTITKEGDAFWCRRNEWMDLITRPRRGRH